MTSVDVVPHALVRRGQGLATFEPAGRREGEHGAVVVKAPVAGLVLSCPVYTGEVVTSSSRIVCIASVENVLVSAKFPAWCSGRVGRGSFAVVRHGISHDPMPATVLSVVAPSERGIADGPADERFTRVVLSIATAPPHLLRPGTPVEVLIEA